MELSGWEFKITMINMLWTLMDKVDSIQEQMDNISRDVEILRKNQKELLEVKKKYCKRNEEYLWWVH